MEKLIVPRNINTPQGQCPVGLEISIGARNREKSTKYQNNSTSSNQNNTLTNPREGGLIGLISIYQDIVVKYFVLAKVKYTLKTKTLGGEVRYIISKQKEKRTDRIFKDVHFVVQWYGHANGFSSNITFIHLQHELIHIIV